MVTENDTMQDNEAQAQLANAKEAAAEAEKIAEKHAQTNRMLEADSDCV